VPKQPSSGDSLEAGRSACSVVSSVSSASSATQARSCHPSSNSANSSFEPKNDNSTSDQHGRQQSTVSSIGDTTTQTVAVRQHRPTSMRLSMSLDGNAQVTPNTDNQISPPKYRQNAAAINIGRVGGLKRSQSAISLGETGPNGIPKLFSDFSRRPSIGRSRDSRTWEFYCDGDARDALTAQAERENSGSAAGAIGLIRSRNVQNPKSETIRNTKTSSQSHRRSKLNRATSSLGRLQNNQAGIKQRSINTVCNPSKLGHIEASLGSPTGDSDKENWIPGTQISSTSRRQEKDGKRVKKQVLNENRHILSQSSGLEAYLAAEQNRESRKHQDPSEEDKENTVAEDEDDKVGNFIRGSQRSARGEDFDCIQGLLSLSQGAWR
jgi:hypothetical protein